MTYLLSKPDDWTLRIADLIKHSPKEGRDSIWSGIRELRGAGYLTFYENRDKHGRLSGGEWLIIERPDED